MIDKLELLLHLAREKHFGRAAQAAGVAQPTLSSALKSLEEQLGVVIVERGSRFRGFTPEGERVLVWARQLTSDARAMRQEIGALRRNLSGELRLGVVPTALPVVSELTVPFRANCPDVHFRILSLTSNAILERLEHLEIDVGISYLEEEPLGRFKGVPLYDERYALLVAPDGPFEGRRTVTWQDAGRLPLCQLSSDMQNRRLIERHLRDARAEPQCTVESNSMLVLYAHVRSGAWASIMPVRFVEEFQGPGRLRAIPLTDPVVRHAVGLILPDRETQIPLVAKFVKLAEKAFPQEERRSTAMSG
jgi:DNA-binding transcriptional LysR family regulator